MNRPPLVLIVEDDVDTARVLKDAFDEDLRVAVAGDGEAALSECAIEDPAVILLDLVLPRMNGEKFLERYRARRGARAKVIAISGLVGGELHALPVDDFVGKPFDVADVVHRVRRYARASKAGGEPVSP